MMVDTVIGEKVITENVFHNFECALPPQWIEPNTPNIPSKSYLPTCNYVKVMPLTRKTLFRLLILYYQQVWSGLLVFF